MSSTGGLSAVHDVRADIVGEAAGPAGEPVEIRSRPEMHARMCRQSGGGEPPDAR